MSSKEEKFKKGQEKAAVQVKIIQAEMKKLEAICDKYEVSVYIESNDNFSGGSYDGEIGSRGWDSSSRHC